jgi:hypothetical protein
VVDRMAATWSPLHEDKPRSSCCSPPSSSIVCTCHIRKPQTKKLKIQMHSRITRSQPQDDIAGVWLSCPRSAWDGICSQACKAKRIATTVNGAPFRLKIPYFLELKRSRQTASQMKDWSIDLFCRSIQIQIHNFIFQIVLTATESKMHRNIGQHHQGILMPSTPKPKPNAIKNE